MHIKLLITSSQGFFSHKHFVQMEFIHCNSRSVHHNRDFVYSFSFDKKEMQPTTSAAIYKCESFEERFHCSKSVKILLHRTQKYLKKWALLCIYRFADRDAKHVHLPYIVKMSRITMEMAYPYEYYANAHLKYKINAWK